MKRVFFFLAISLSLTLSAQERPKISSAIIAKDRGDLEAAKGHIAEAAAIIEEKGAGEVKDKTLSKFYYNRGHINLMIASSSDDALRASNPDALDIARQAFNNVFALEERTGEDKYVDEAKTQMPYLAQQIATRGIEASQQQNYKQAYNDFLATYELKKENELGTDTTMMYNAALMAQQGKMYDEAIEILEKLMSMNYKGVEFKAVEVETGNQVTFPNKAQMEMAVKSEQYQNPTIEGDIRADLYVNAANLYLTQLGDTVAYDKMVAEGRKKFPEDENLLRAELQKFLETKQYDKAMGNLNQAIKQDPDNKLFYYIKGFIYHTSLDSIPPAREAYKQSMKRDSNYIEPVYMLGLTYVDEANAISEEMNALGLNEKSKYKKLQAEQKELFGKAQEYFETARDIDPDDLDTLNALKEVYYKLKMYEEAKELQAKIDQMG